MVWKVNPHTFRYIWHLDVHMRIGTKVSHSEDHRETSFGQPFAPTSLDEPACIPVFPLLCMSYE
jgi:hypothetical protein